MILDFLRSAPNILVDGPPPQAYRSRKRKRPQEEDDEEEEGGSMDEVSQGDSTGSRGTILITLRNVLPYTTWYVPLRWQTCLAA